MANQAVEKMLAHMRSAGQPTDLETMRTQFDALASAQSMPDGARFEPITLGDVPAERVGVGEATGPGVILYFHGGGYMFGSALGYRALTTTLAAASQRPVLAVNYRLAPEHPFPAAVEDTTAAYRAVLDSGTPASHVAFAGDSAGGGLVVATMLNARDVGLPMPAAGYGLSPWLDIACEGQSFTELAAVDPLMTAEGALGCQAAYLQGGDAHHPLASPLQADFAGLPPLMLQVGATEMFLDDSIRAARKAALAGVHVELQIWPDMPHVWQLWPSFIPEAVTALESGGDFLRKRMTPASR